jgi:hypothetical protein
MRDVRMDFARGWAALLLIGPPVVLIATAMTYWSAQRALLQRDGDDLAIVAEHVAKAADAYIARIVNDLGMMTANPAIVQVAREHSAQPHDVGAEKALDDYWKQTSPDKVVPEFEARIKAIVTDAETSKYFRAIVRANASIVREVLLADRDGRLIAASARTDDYLQADDDPWWPEDRAGFASCGGALSSCALFSDVLWDRSSGASGFQVVAAIVARASDGDAANAGLVGVLKVVIDPRELQQLTLLPADDLEVRFRTTAGQSLFGGGDGPLRNHAASPRFQERSLAGPMGKYWRVAVRTAAERPAAGAWRIPLAWLTLAVLTLLATAWAASVWRETRTLTIATRSAR